MAASSAWRSTTDRKTAHVTPGMQADAARLFAATIDDSGGEGDDADGGAGIVILEQG